MSLWVVDLEWTLSNAVLVEADTREEAVELARDEEYHRSAYALGEENFTASCWRAASGPLTEAPHDLAGSSMIAANGEHIEYDEWLRLRDEREAEAEVRRNTPGTREYQERVEALGQMRLLGDAP